MYERRIKLLLLLPDMKTRCISHGRYIVKELPFAIESPVGRRTSPFFFYTLTLSSLVIYVFGMIVDLLSMVCSNDIQQMRKYIHVTFELTVLLKILKETESCGSIEVF